MSQKELLSQSDFSAWCRRVKNSWEGKQSSYLFIDEKLHRSVKLKTKDGETLVDVCALCIDDCIAVGINEIRSFQALASTLRGEIKKTNAEFEISKPLEQKNRRSMLPFEEHLVDELPNGCYLLTKKESGTQNKNSQDIQNIDSPEYEPAKVTKEPCFKAINSLPDTATLVRHLKSSKEVFILQNRLTQLQDGLEGQKFLNALMHAVECDEISFKCTLYHPESQIAIDREKALNLPLRLLIKQCIEKLHASMQDSLKKSGKENFSNFEFRIATAHLPYTIYGFDNRIYLGWLVHGSQSNDYNHLVLQGPEGAFEVVKGFFDAFWSGSTDVIDLTKPLDDILNDPRFKTGTHDISTHKAPCDVSANIPAIPTPKGRGGKRGT
jgi:hypothetical protein